MTDQKSKYEEAASILLSQLCKRWKLSIEGEIIAKDVILSAIIQGASFARKELEAKAEEFYSFGFREGRDKATKDQDVVINDLQDKLLERQKEYAEAITELKQLQEENQRLKEALAYALKHWGKADNLLLHQEFRDSARKLIEL